MDQGQRSLIRQVIKVVWTGGERPSLLLANADPLVIEGPLRFRLTPKRRCIGWRDPDSGERHSCPQGAMPPPLQCVSCSRREGFWACMTCDGFACPTLAPAMEAYCRKTHHLYLACFGGTDIKVGTASDSRERMRPLEQGPLGAALIADGPGPIIKQMEAILARGGFMEHMRRGDKWRQFRRPTTPAQAQRRVLDGALRAKDLLPSQYEAYRHLTARFVDLPDWPDLRPAELVVPGEHDLIEGTVLGSRGHLTLLDDGVGKVALDLASLRGRFIDLDPIAGRPPTRQLGLF